VTADQINATRAEHVVHFYRTDDGPADRAAAYLEAALATGGVAIAIATGPHLRAIGRHLSAIGVDRQGAIEDGRLVLLDASETLAKLTTDGRVDRRAFDRVVGNTLRAACGRARAVRAYGEMVDLLWQVGNIPGAIELEKVWNELIAELRFGLLCAYQSGAVAAPEHEHALREVCELHSSVSSDPGAEPIAGSDPAASREVTCEFQPDAGAPRAARRFVEDTLQRWGHDDSVVTDVRLLTSELVTNAVIHTRSPFSVSISWQPTKLRLAVHDQSATEPVLAEWSIHGPTGGRGLLIVEALADDWGFAMTPHGKTVWAELSER
jgi:anti-sigma regulatory factor (Ser/Thr protein kinase)